MDANNSYPNKDLAPAIIQLRMKLGTEEHRMYAHLIKRYGVNNVATIVREGIKSLTYACFPELFHYGIFIGENAEKSSPIQSDSDISNLGH